MIGLLNRNHTEAAFPPFLLFYLKNVNKKQKTNPSVNSSTNNKKSIERKLVIKKLKLQVGCLFLSYMIVDCWSDAINNCKTNKQQFKDTGKVRRALFTTFLYFIDLTINREHFQQIN